jgi:hypothetical protein
MMVLCSNDSSKAFHAFAQQHYGKVGWLMGPSTWKTPRSHLPYALDNDAYSAYVNGSSWNVANWFSMLGKAKSKLQQPIWALAPDTVANREDTLLKWKRFSPVLKSLDWPIAFAVQDGMTVGDVPKDADVIFIGGTTTWKWKTLPMWCESFPRIHVGRVTTGFRLEIAERNGAESCDGTGFFRGSFHSRQAKQLQAFVEGHRNRTPLLAL